MNYNLVYESSSSEINFIFIIISIIAIVIFIFYFFKIDIKNKFMKFSLVISVFFIFLSLYGIYDNNKLDEFIQESIKNKKYKVVEGQIEELHVMPFSGHDCESFEVNNKYFKILFTGNYPDTKTLFYTLTKNRKGPITHNGQKVKIYYINMNNENKIIKLYIK